MTLMLRSQLSRERDDWTVVHHTAATLARVQRSGTSTLTLRSMIRDGAFGEAAQFTDVDLWWWIHRELASGHGRLVLARPTPAIPHCGVGRITNKHAPKELVEIDGINRPGSSKKVQLEKNTASAYATLVKAARAEGFQAPLFAVVSGYRDQKKQADLFQKALKKYGSVAEARKWVAPPGHSAHGTGCAVDLWLGFPCGKETNAQIKKSDAYHWMVRNASACGFNPYTREGWHWEYNVGEIY